MDGPGPSIEDSSAPTQAAQAVACNLAERVTSFPMSTCHLGLRNALVANIAAADSLGMAPALSRGG